MELIIMATESAHDFIARSHGPHITCLLSEMAMIGIVVNVLILNYFLFCFCFFGSIAIGLQAKLLGFTAPFFFVLFLWQRKSWHAEHNFFLFIFFYSFRHRSNSLPFLFY